jgi:hypothetical protein
MSDPANVAVIQSFRKVVKNTAAVYHGVSLCALTYRFVFDLRVQAGVKNERNIASVIQNCGCPKMNGFICGGTNGAKQSGFRSIE